MNSQIRTDIALPTGESRVCKRCGKNKPIKSFSLMRGKHSDDRKTICVTCETGIKKARNLYDMELEEMNKFLAEPCFVCKTRSEKIQLNQYGFPIAALCKQCFEYIHYVDDDETILHAYNHAVFARDFPFYLKYRTRLIKTPEQTPLLDFINENAST